MSLWRQNNPSLWLSWTLSIPKWVSILWHAACAPSDAKLLEGGVDVPHLFQYSDTNLLTKQFINYTIFFYHYRRIFIFIWCKTYNIFMADYGHFFSLYWYMMTSHIKMLILKSSISWRRTVMPYMCKHPSYNGFIFLFRCTSSMVVIPRGIAVRRWADCRKFNP